MKAPSTPRELLEEGNYIATVYRIIYIGTVDGEWKGQSISSYKVDITWELNNELKIFKEGDEPKPVVLSKRYTLSMAPKANLRPIVEGIVGGMSDAEAVNFDIDEILGKSCLLNVTHGVSETGKDFLKVQTSKLMKGMDAPKPFNPQKILSYQNWDEELFNSLPQFMKDDMVKTPEYKMLMNKGIELPIVNVDTGEVKDYSDIPF